MITSVHSSISTSMPDEAVFIANEYTGTLTCITAKPIRIPMEVMHVKDGWKVPNHAHTSTYDFLPFSFLPTS